MVDLTLLFPTSSECRNIDIDKVAMFYHFICHNKQVVINHSSRGYAVLCNGFKSPRGDLSHYNADGWYSIGHFKTLAPAEKLFRESVVDILVNRYFNYG